MRYIIADEDKTVTKNVKFTKKDKNDRNIPVDLSVTYKFLSVEGFTEFTEQTGPLLDDDGEKLEESLSESAQRIAEIMRPVVVDIEGVFDKDGNEIPYSDEVFNVVFNDMEARPAIIDAFQVLHTPTGRKQARAKN